MTTYYKLTDSNGQSHGGTQWGAGITHKATGTGKGFCSADLVHLYSHPLLAVLFNPIHANFSHGYRLWEATADTVIDDDGLKLGAKEVTTVRETEVPHVTTAQRVRFAILVALEANHTSAFVQWANDWLNINDRSTGAAKTSGVMGGNGAVQAAQAARLAARAAEWAAEAVEAAGERAVDLPLIMLAKRAIQEEPE